MLLRGCSCVVAILGWSSNFLVIEVQPPSAIAFSSQSALAKDLFRVSFKIITIYCECYGMRKPIKVNVMAT